MRYFLLILLLAGCGFSSVYSSTTAGIVVVEQSNDLGRKFLRILKDLPYFANDNQDIKYEVTYNISKNTVSSLIEKDSITKRYEAVLELSYSVLNVHLGKKITSGVLRSSSAYNSAQSEFATYVSDEDAMKNSMRSLAEELEQIMMML
jgi:hypothetical protein